MSAIFLLAFSTASLLKNLPSSVTLGSSAWAWETSPSQPTRRAGIISPQSDARMVACLLVREGRSLAVGLQRRFDGVEGVEQAGVELHFAEGGEELLAGHLAVRV